MSNENAFLVKTLNLLSDFSSSSPIETLIEKVMDIGTEATNADGCFFFGITPTGFMNLLYYKIKSLKEETSGISNMGLFPSVYLPDIKEKPILHPAEICAIKKDIINTSNIYNEPNIDISAIAAFDEQNNYNSVSLLSFPIFDSNKNINGVAMFINATTDTGKIINFTISDQEKLVALCQIISLSIERKQLKESYSQLLESFIDILAKAIDAKSPYTGLHCQHVPIITRMLAAAAVAETEGPFKNFELNNDDWYALHIASWLHDCGKLITPEYIVDKSAKLETVYNRIHEIRDRFEILRRDAHIEYLQKRLQNIDTKENLQAEFVEKVKQLNDDFEFIGKCNIGDVPLSKQDTERLENLSENLSFMRYFSRMTGLSWGEKQRITNPEKYEKPEQEFILQDRPEQLKSLYNQGELTNIKIERGTINSEERKKINEHIITTIDILKSIPFPPELKNVVEYAGAHHERVDGKGYPNGLKGSQMSIPAKIMAIADVYEALTAKDRPYKKPKKLSEILSIMRDMKNNGHLDPDLYELFIKSKVYLDYAKEYIDKSQIDDVDPTDYL